VCGEVVAPMLLLAAKIFELGLVGVVATRRCCWIMFGCGKLCWLDTGN